MSAHSHGKEGARMRLASCVLAALALLGCKSTPSGPARHLPTQVIGGHESTLVNTLCPAGMYVVELQAFSRPNEWITHLYMTCGAWNGFRFADRSSPLKIGPGGGTEASGGGCGHGSAAVIGAVVSANAGHLRRLDLSCMGNVSGVGTSNFTVGIPAGGTVLGSAQCAADRLATGLQSKVSTAGVDGLGLLCGPKP